MKRKRNLAIATSAFVVLCGIGLVCCQQPSKQAVTVTEPRSDAGETDAPPPAKTQTDPAEPVTPPDQAAVEPPADIDMDDPDQPEPATPRYLAIVESIDPAKRPTVTTRIEAPRLLEVDTDNIQRLRLTREGLPLAANRSIVLRIDGQGIEWTPNVLAIELERSPAGVWSVVRRRPIEP